MLNPARFWECGRGEFGEGRDSESGESGVVTYSEPEDSLYIESSGSLYVT